MQGAAGVFYQVKEMVYVQFSKVPLPDMTAEMLGALAATMLAQAQESLYYKTTLGEIVVSLYWRDASPNTLECLYWRDASLHTLDCCIGGMHLFIY